MDIILEHNEFKNKILYKSITDDLILKLDKIRSEISVDNVYECHQWVYSSSDYLKSKYSNISFYYGSLDVTDVKTYVKEYKSIDKKLDPILSTYGLHKYLEYYSGHSFVKINNIFIDLTLNSEGVSYEDVQKVDKILVDSNLEFKDYSYLKKLNYNIKKI